MARRPYIPVIVMVGLVALVVAVVFQMRQVDAFDKAYGALVDDLGARVSNALQNRDQAPALFTHLEQTTQGQIKALPPASQDFQRGLRARLEGLIGDAVKLNQVDPLTAQSEKTLNELFLQLSDMRECLKAGVAVKPQF